MTAAAKKCDDCGHYHHPKRAHTFAYRETPPVVVIQRIETADEPVGVLASAEAWFDLKCEVCGEKFEAKRRHATTCSAKCRQRKRRAK